MYTHTHTHTHTHTCSYVAVRGTVATMWPWWRVQVAILSYIAYKLFVFFRADGDFTVISKRLKPEYFKGKVIWITGASSGSEYLIIAWINISMIIDL